MCGAGAGLLGQFGERRRERVGGPGVHGWCAKTPLNYVAIVWATTKSVALRIKEQRDIVTGM